MVKISVIVPVYNTENYLERCINSILNQTYKEIELILVDDGSTDKSGRICDEYLKKDSRVKVIHTENGGQSKARNLGLDIASGEYIGFVDSDDWISKDMYEYLLNNLIKNDCEISNVDYVLVKDNNKLHINKDDKTKIYYNEEILYEYLLEGTLRGSYSFCRNLYKRNLFDGIKFPEGKINEDIVTNYKVMKKAKKMIKSNFVGYYYFQDNNSTTRGGLKSRDFNLLEVSNELLEITSNQSNEKIYYLAKVKLARSYYSLLAKIAIYGIDDKKIEARKVIKELTCNLRKNYMLLISSPITLNRKIAITLLTININCLKIPYNILKQFKYYNL